jgi:hypothetical protein
VKRRWLSEIDWSEPAFTGVSLTTSLRDDLALFGDAMLKRLGEEYFIFTKERERAVHFHANIFRKAGENWRALAVKTLVDDGAVEE